MAQEFRIEVAGIEPEEPGRARVRLKLIVPEDIATKMIERELTWMYARELGGRVALKARRLPWGRGVRLAEEGESWAVRLRGVSPEHEVLLSEIAVAAADACNRELGPGGAMGERLRTILDRLRPGDAS